MVSDEETLGRTIRATMEVNNNLGTEGASETILPASYYELIEVRGTRIKETKIVSAASTLIWGHASQGTWGSFNWGNTGSGTLFQVYNDNDFFIEGMYDGRFIGSPITATIDYAIGSISFGSGDYFTSEIIGYHPDYNITGATFYLLTTDYNIGSLNFYLSNNNTNWFNINNYFRKKYDFSTTGDRPYYKIISTGTGQYLKRDANLNLIGVKYYKTLK